MNDTGSRLHFVRERWHLTPDALADRTGVDAGTIQGIEDGAIEPDATTAQRLADVLCIYAQWLTDGEEPMVPLWCMTVEDQHRVQNGPGSESLPGYVIVGPGPWHRDEGENWHVDRTGERNANDAR